MEDTELHLNKNQTVIKTENLDIYYGNYRAVRDVTLDITKNQITAFIGPSGCGKSTILRCFNRLNDLKVGYLVEYDQTDVIFGSPKEQTTRDYVSGSFG
jgi:phosphate transport system ATP-binding protein